VQPSQERRPRHPGRLPRRNTDRLEDAVAWALSCLALLGLLVALLVGRSVHAGVMDGVRLQAPDRTEVEAVLNREEPMPYPEYSATAKQMTARYTDGAGGDHEVTVTVGASRAVGETVEIWVDGEGRMVPAPVTAVTALMAGVVAAAGFVALGGVALLGAWAAVRRFTEARNAAAWTTEWARVEPEWSGR